MNMTRRQFLKNMAALAAVPAVVKAESLMKIWVPPEQKVFLGMDPAAPGGDTTEVWLLNHESKKIEYIGPKDGRIYTVSELYDWFKTQVSHPPPAHHSDILRLDHGLDLSDSAAEHLTNGTVQTHDSLYTSLSTLGKV